MRVYDAHGTHWHSYDLRRDEREWPAEDDYPPADPDEAEALLNEIMADRPAPGEPERGAYGSICAWADAETGGAY